MVVADLAPFEIAGLFPRLASNAIVATTAAAVAMATHRRQRGGRDSLSSGGVVDDGSGRETEESAEGITAAGDAFIAGILPP